MSMAVWASANQRKPGLAVVIPLPTRQVEGGDGVPTESAQEIGRDPSSQPEGHDPEAAVEVTGEGRGARGIGDPEIGGEIPGHSQGDEIRRLELEKKGSPQAVPMLHIGGVGQEARVLRVEGDVEIGTGLGSKGERSQGKQEEDGN